MRGEAGNVHCPGWWSERYNMMNWLIMRNPDLLKNQHAEISCTYLYEWKFFEFLYLEQHFVLTSWYSHPKPT